MIDVRPATAEEMILALVQAEVSHWDVRSDALDRIRANKARLVDHGNPTAATHG